MGVFESYFSFVPLNLVGDKAWEKPWVSSHAFSCSLKMAGKDTVSLFGFVWLSHPPSCNEQEGFVPAGEVACEETATCPHIRAADNRDGLCMLGLITRQATCPWWNTQAWEEVAPCGWERTPLCTLTAQTWVGMLGHVNWDGLHGKESCCHPSEPLLGLL